MSDDKPNFPCQCDMDDDCSRECELQIQMENDAANPTIIELRAEVERLRRRLSSIIDSIECDDYEGAYDERR